MSGKWQLRVQRGKAGVRWTRCILLGYFTYLPPSAGRVRIFCRPFWRWYEGRWYVLVWFGAITAVGARNNGRCLVNWGKMVWDLQRSTTMATTRSADGLAHEPIVHVRRCSCCWATIRLWPLLSCARAMSRLEAAFVAVELGFGLCAAAATRLPRSCPATASQPASPLLSQACQALTTY